MPEREELESFKRVTENKVRGLRCPTHRRRPEVCFNGSSLRDVTIRMSGCCARLMELANAAIAERDPDRCGKAPPQETT